MTLTSICVYCGSSFGLLPEYKETAFAFGELLASRRITLVYGGGNVGLMGAVADGALARGGKVIGVMPQLLVDKEVAHRGLTELHVVSSMHERKTMMADLSDAFVALPGGNGTLEEIFEVYTWTQLGFHAKPCAFLDVAGFYQPLAAFLTGVAEQGFLKTEHLEMLMMETDMERLLQRFTAYEHRPVQKWIDR